MGNMAMTLRAVCVCARAFDMPIIMNWFRAHRYHGDKLLGPDYISENGKVNPCCCSAQPSANDDDFATIVQKDFPMT